MEFSKMTIAFSQELAHTNIRYREEVIQLAIFFPQPENAIEKVHRVFSTIHVYKDTRPRAIDLPSPGSQAARSLLLLEAEAAVEVAQAAGR